MKAVIIDDEKLAVDEMKYLLSEYADITVTGVFTEAASALRYLARNSVDVVFLDIHMPVIGGLEISEMMQNWVYKPHVVFITAYDDHSLDAFELGAFDYIVKPVEAQRLEKSIRRLREHIGERAGKCSHLMVHSEGVYIPVQLDDIIAIIARNGIVEINTKETVICVHDSLSDLERKLYDARFIRCHRSYIINIDKVKLIEPLEKGLLVKMCGMKEAVPVSRSNVMNFKEKMSIQ